MIRTKAISLLIYWAISGVVSAQVGIGTNTPKGSLEIVGDTAQPSKSGSSKNGILRLGTTTTNGVLDLGVAKDNYGWIQARNSNDYSTNMPLLLNPNGGNVGVNTVSPDETLTVQGNVQATGTVRAAGAGQILNMVFLDESDLNFSSNVVVSGTSETTIVSYTYTPVSNSSKIYVEYDGRAYLSGSSTDVVETFLNIGGTRVQANAMRFDGGSSGGGGGRGNPPFPLMGYYQNSSTNSLIISVSAYRTSTDDNLTVYPDATLIIKEISR
jgi:hypothetical protein